MAAGEALHFERTQLTTKYVDHTSTNKNVEERGMLYRGMTNGALSWKVNKQDRTIVRSGEDGVRARCLWQSLTGCSRGLGQAGSTRDAKHEAMQFQFTRFTALFNVMMRALVIFCANRTFPYVAASSIGAMVLSGMERLTSWPFMLR